MIDRYMCVLDFRIWHWFMLVRSENRGNTSHDRVWRSPSSHEGSRMYVQYSGYVTLIHGWNPRQVKAITICAPMRLRVRKYVKTCSRQGQPLGRRTPMMMLMIQCLECIDIGQNVCWPNPHLHSYFGMNRCVPHSQFKKTWSRVLVPLWKTSLLP